MGKLIVLFIFMFCLPNISQAEGKKPQINIESSGDGSSIYIKVIETHRLLNFYLTSVGEVRNWRITTKKADVSMYFTNEFCQTIIVMVERKGVKRVFLLSRKDTKKKDKEGEKGLFVAADIGLQKHKQKYGLVVLAKKEAKRKQAEYKKKYKKRKAKEKKEKEFEKMLPQFLKDNLR